MKEGQMDISTIYWDQRLGPWSDLGEAAARSRQNLAEQGFDENAVHALVQEHDVFLASAREVGQTQA